MIFMFIFWAFLIVGLILLIKWILRTTRKAPEFEHSTSRALDILKERYARSEISKEEFDDKKGDLLS